MTTRNDKKIAARQTEPDSLRANPGLPMIGFLILETIVGYEWLISGLTKIVRGDFTSGLAGEMSDKLAGVPNWYAAFINGVVIPNATLFGYLIEIGEVLVGLALIVLPLIWLFAWERIPARLQSAAVFLVAAASIGGIFMALNFHVANGNSHPWLIPAHSFDEGVDFDSLLAILNIVTAAINIFIISRFRQPISEVSVAPAKVQQPKYS